MCHDEIAIDLTCTLLLKHVPGAALRFATRAPRYASTRAYAAIVVQV